MIDAHHHLWNPDVREYGWLMGGQVWASDEELARLRRPFTLAELAPLAASAGVTGTVVVQTVNDSWETHDLLAMAAGMDPYGGSVGARHANGLILGVVGWVDLVAGDVEQAVSRLRSKPGGRLLRGVRHPLLGEPDPNWLTRSEVLAGLRELGEARLCFDVVALPGQLEAAVGAARSVPELSFVLDHMGGPPASTRDPAGDSARAWAGAIRDLGALSNVTCKLSGIHGASARAEELRPFFDTVLEAFGPERLLFGSDWPVSSLTAGYGAVLELYRELTASLTRAEQDAIFEGTARRVYGLEPQGTGDDPAAVPGSP
ncbi:MAG: amidohydrolase family protein [Actinomycetota bacterium]|nr:amidohydrolase family protein [Actinomycetota bacterium]